MPHEVALQTLDVSLTMNLGDVSSQCILVINELAPSRVMHFAMQGKKCNRIHRLKDDDDIDQNMFFLKKKIREKTHTKNTDITTMLLLLEYLLKRVHIQLMISMLVSNSTSDILYRYHYYHHHLAEFMCDKES